MSKDRDYVLFLEDILESIAKIEKYTEDLTYQEFQRPSSFYLTPEFCNEKQVKTR